LAACRYRQGGAQRLHDTAVRLPPGPTRSLGAALASSTRLAYASPMGAAPTRPVMQCVPSSCLLAGASRRVTGSRFIQQRRIAAPLMAPSIVASVVSDRCRKRRSWRHSRTWYRHSISDNSFSRSRTT
jgi:hypothetical protein